MAGVLLGALCGILMRCATAGPLSLAMLIAIASTLALCNLELDASSLVVSMLQTYGGIFCSAALPRVVKRRSVPAMPLSRSSARSARRAGKTPRQNSSDRCESCTSCRPICRRRAMAADCRVHSLCRALAAHGHAVEATTSIDGPARHGGAVRSAGHAGRREGSLFCVAPAAPLVVCAVIDAIAARRNSGADVHLHSLSCGRLGGRHGCRTSGAYRSVISPRGMLVKSLIASRNRLIKSAWIALIERSNLEQAAAIHATSAIEAEEIQKFGWRLRLIAVVPNGVDAIEQSASQETRQEMRQDSPAADITALAGLEPLVLFFGRLAQVKGLDRLLGAFARTRRGTLAIVGNDYEGLAAGLADMARQLRIDDRVRILPRTITDAEKECMFAAARVFVLPSYSESFGNVVLEAMQRGSPVIVTPGPVPRSREGIRRRLVAGGDAHRSGAAIDRLTEDAAKSSAMGEAGRRHVSERYGWHVAARMEALYGELKAAQGPACSTRSPLDHHLQRGAEYRAHGPQAVVGETDRGGSTAAALEKCWTCCEASLRSTLSSIRSAISPANAISVSPRSIRHGCCRSMPITSSAMFWLRNSPGCARRTTLPATGRGSSIAFTVALCAARSTRPGSCSTARTKRAIAMKVTATAPPSTAKFSHSPASSITTTASRWHAGSIRSNVTRKPRPAISLKRRPRCKLITRSDAHSPSGLGGARSPGFCSTRRIVKGCILDGGPAGINTDVCSGFAAETLIATICKFSSVRLRG